MKTLIIHPGHYQTDFRMKGLSIKRAGDAGHDLCKDESGYYISNDFKIDPATAKISTKELIKWLKQLYEALPFDKIKIDGYYELTAEEIMKLIKS